MSSPRETNPGLERLAMKIERASHVTADLVGDVVANGCVRISSLRNDSPAIASLSRLVGGGDWVAAALLLVELELPLWRLRRLLLDDGRWLCTLSRQPELPLGLDQVAEATHPVLSLAILGALIEARRSPDILDDHVSSGTAQIGVGEQAVCPDNFA